MSKKKKNGRLAKFTSKLSRSKSNRKPNDTFIIKHSQNNLQNDNSINISSFDPRRIIFISLRGLHRTWNSCPSHILYTSIFLLPIKRNWIYKYSKYAKQKESALSSELSLFLELTQDENFLDLLKWKNSQGLLFFVLDEYEPINSTNDVHSTIDPLIHPFWCYLSKQLTYLYDPVSEKHYNPLKLDRKWYHMNTWISKYNIKSPTILSELYFLSLQFKAVQEIIYQSNPKSLLPVSAYDTSIYESFTKKSGLCDVIADAQRNDFVFTHHYDPDDIEDDIFV